MRNYIITDQLNPASALSTDVKCFTFVADCDQEAREVFDDAVANGDAGYSEFNTQRINAKLWRTKAFINGGKPLIAQTPTI
jgi:hypothetical protein